MVDRAAPAGTRTEAFGLLMTASSTGGSAGAIAAGALIGHAGATGAFAVAALAGALAVLVVIVGYRTLDPVCPLTLEPQPA